MLRSSWLPLLSVSALGLILLPPASRASGVSGLDAVVVEYDAGLGTLPPAQGWTVFTEDRPPDDGLTDANYTLSAGILTQGPTGGAVGDETNRQWITAPAFDLDFDEDVAIVDLELRILDSTITVPPSTGPRAGFGVLLSDAEGERVVLYVGTSELFLFGTDSATSGVASFAASAGFAQYRLRVDAHGASVRVNGTELAHLPRASFGLSTSQDQLIVGDLTINEHSSSELRSISAGRAAPAETEVRELEWVTEIVPAGGPEISELKSSLVSCPPGKYVIAGGAAVQMGSAILLNDSHPAGGPPYTQWFARAEQVLPEGGPWELRVDVLCGEIAGQEIITRTAANSGWSGSASASCLGKLAVGSGAQSSPESARERIGLRESAPVAPPGAVWRASGYDFEEGLVEGVHFDMTAYATCTHARDWVIETSATPSDSTAPKMATAACPAGMLAIGGGARVIGGSGAASVVASRPQSSGGALPDQWTARAVHSLPPTEAWNLEVTAFCTRPAGATVTRYGLGGRWRADSGQPLDDRGRNPGTLLNGASIVAGISGQAFSFERASQQWMRIPGEDFYPQGSFTVDAWIQTDDLAPGEPATIAALYDIGGDTGVANWSTWMLGLDENGFPQGWARPGSINQLSIVSGTESLADGAVHHVALVRDLSPPAPRHLLYADGVLVAEDPVESAEGGPLFPGDSANVDPVSVGVWRDGDATTVSREWDGLIDDLKFYDRALSAEDVRNTAGCGLPLVPRVLNLDASRFAATTAAADGHRLCAFLEAGSYTLDLVTPDLDPAARFTAWSSSEGAPWVTAWAATPQIDPGITGGSPTGAATAQDAFDDTPTRQETLTLTQDQLVHFSLVDSPPVDDNHGGVSIRVARAAGADSDGDLVDDAGDNCAAWPNPGQSDLDGNGIGDACECGDQTGDGTVNVADILAINEVIFELQPAAPLCDTNEDGLCNVADILGANGKIFGQPAYCARYPSP